MIDRRWDRGISIFFAVIAGTHIGKLTEVLIENKNAWSAFLWTLTIIFFLYAAWIMSGDNCKEKP